MSKLIAIGVVGVFVAAVPAQASVSFDSLTIVASTSGFAAKGGPPISDQDMSDPAPVSGYQASFVRAAASEAVDPDPDVRAAADARVELAFANPGAFTFAVTGSEQLTLPTASSFAAANASGSLNYSFFLFEAQNFTFTHSLTTNAQFTFASALLRRASGSPLDPPLFNLLAQNGALAPVSGQLSAGRYALFLSSTSAANFIGTQASQVTSRSDSIFNFSVTAPVPEPTSWAMLIGGFGLTGAALRRRTAANSVGGCRGRPVTA